MYMKCLNCEKELVGSQTKYCCVKCQFEYQNKLKIEEWKRGEFDGLKGQSQISDIIRKYMLEKSGYKCELCGWGEINPFTNKIPLEIHHKNGDYKDNKEENLQVLCPNCHSLTNSYRGANRDSGRKDRLLYVPRQKKNHCIDCGKEITYQATRCIDCAGKNRITEIPINRNELKKLIRSTPFTKIGEQFRVSDNCIRKWCQKYDLPFKVSEIKKISDLDWENL